jgi:hypothetical protein
MIRCTAGVSFFMTWGGGSEARAVDAASAIAD